MPNTQLDAVIDLLTNRESPENPTVEDSRERFEQFARAVGGDTPASVRRVDADGVPADLVSAGGPSSGKAILYLHGGGYVIGSSATHRELARRLSVAADADVLTIDYRLAPENPFPAPVEDAVTAYKWLIGQGCDPAGVAIAGDSAGGGLTVATLVSLRDQDIPLPACGVCLSPWVDMEGIGDSMTSRAALDPMVQREGLVANGRDLSRRRRSAGLRSPRRSTPTFTACRPFSYRSARARRSTTMPLGSPRGPRRPELRPASSPGRR